MWTLSTTMPRVQVWVCLFSILLTLSWCWLMRKSNWGTSIYLLYMNHYFMCNAIILFNSNWSAGRMLKWVSNHLSAAAAAALSTAGAAKPTPARARPALLLCQEQFQLPQPGLQWGYSFSFPLLPPAVALSPNSVTNSPNSFICHLIPCLLAAAFLSGSMFAICLCTLVLSKNMQRPSSWVLWKHHT